jgi:hypothetical protein
MIEFKMPPSFDDANMSVSSLLCSLLNPVNSHLNKFRRLNYEPWVIQANALKGVTSVANEGVQEKETIVSSGRNVDETS